MEKIYLDEKGYNQYIEEIKKYKDKKTINASTGSEAYNDAVGDGWHDNFAYEEAMREEKKIMAKIEELVKMKPYIKLINPIKQDKKIINIGDVLKIRIKYSADDIEECYIKLTGNFISNLAEDNDVQEITLNSPIGSSIYGKNIDEKIKSKINDNIIEIEILEKIK